MCVFVLRGNRAMRSVNESDGREQFHVSHWVLLATNNFPCESPTTFTFTCPAGKKKLEGKRIKKINRSTKPAVPLFSSQKVLLFNAEIYRVGYTRSFPGSKAAVIPRLSEALQGAREARPVPSRPAFPAVTPRLPPRRARAALASGGSSEHAARPPHRRVLSPDRPGTLRVCQEKGNLRQNKVSIIPSLHNLLLFFSTELISFQWNWPVRPKPSKNAGRKTSKSII